MLTLFTWYLHLTERRRSGRNDAAHSRDHRHRARESEAVERAHACVLLECKAIPSPFLLDSLLPLLFPLFSTLPRPSTLHPYAQLICLQSDPTF